MAEKDWLEGWLGLAVWLAGGHWLVDWRDKGWNKGWLADWLKKIWLVTSAGGSAGGLGQGWRDVFGGTRLADWLDSVDKIVVVVVVVVVVVFLVGNFFDGGSLYKNFTLQKVIEKSEKFLKKFFEK